MKFSGAIMKKVVKKIIIPPYLGAAYYPECWPAAQVDKDIALMKDAGMNVMRVAEFAWSRIEPSKGKFDFEWLHRVVDKLASADIGVIMCTPTATPPIWLTEKHPEVLYQTENGRDVSHGGRRHYCPMSPIYRDYTKVVVERMAREFCNDPAIIGWQIDNEVNFFKKPCVCPVCVAAFRRMMREKYKTIENLNTAWCTTLWSQEYSSFDQLPIPRTDIWHHPSLLTAWSEFGSFAYVDYVGFQADILHQSVTQPIGTDMMPTGQVDYVDMHRQLDVVQFNHYIGMEQLWHTGFWFDFLRGLKSRPFWNTETHTSWNGATTANGYKAPGFCLVNSWLPIAHGGEATLYWLWRQHFAGHELMHGAVVSSCGRPLHMIDEVRAVSDGFSRCADFLNNTRPVSTGIALHFSNRMQEFFTHQPMVNNFRYPWESLMQRVYHPLQQAHFRMNVLEPAQSLDGMKVIVSPFLPVLDEGDLRPRLKSWIENGGIWIAGPLTDNRDSHAAKFTHAAYGTLEEWGGFRSKFEIPGDPKNFELTFDGKKNYSGNCWYDAMELAGGRSVATYTEGPMKGLAAIVENKMGKGKVIVLGTCPEPAALVSLIAREAKKAGILPVAKASTNLLCIPRSGKGGEGMIVIEIENKSASLTLAKASVDLLTGKKYPRGIVPVKPYSVMVLKY